MNKSYDIQANSGYLLLRATQQYRLEIAQILRPYDVTPTQFFIMMSIWYQEKHMAPPTQVQTAQYAAIDLNVTSQVVRKLMSRSLVKRLVDPRDSRAYRLSLTPEGKSLATITGQVAEGFHRSFFSAINQQNLNTELAKLISK